MVKRITQRPGFRHRPRATFATFLPGGTPRSIEEIPPRCQVRQGAKQAKGYGAVVAVNDMRDQALVVQARRPHHKRPNRARLFRYLERPKIRLARSAIVCREDQSSKLMLRPIQIFKHAIAPAGRSAAVPGRFDSFRVRKIKMRARTPALHKPLRRAARGTWSNRDVIARAKQAKQVKTSSVSQHLTNIPPKNEPRPAEPSCLLCLRGSSPLISNFSLCEAFPVPPPDPSTANAPRTIRACARRTRRKPGTIFSICCR